MIGAWAVPTLVAHGTRRAAGAVPARRRCAARSSGASCSASPAPAPTWPSLRTKAERVEGGWRLTGQKVWTSLAQYADWGICLARTDPDAPKHTGITYFLVDMKRRASTSGRCAS